MKERKRCSPWAGESGSSVAGGSTQSYDFTCIVPMRSLLKTVIPGWLWRGMTAVAGRKKTHICGRKKTHIGTTKHKFYILKMFQVLKNKPAGAKHAVILTIYMLARQCAIEETCLLNLLLSNLEITNVRVSDST